MERHKSRMKDLFASIKPIPAVTPQKKKGRPAKAKPPTEQNPIEPEEKPKSKPKENIPKAIKEQVWLTYVGPNFKTKCIVTWCKNDITVFDFHTGHNIPEKHGGTLDIANLRPICSRCNLSMGSNYTISEWIELSQVAPQPQPQPQTKLSRFLCWKKKLMNSFAQP